MVDLHVVSPSKYSSMRHDCWQKISWPEDLIVTFRYSTLNPSPSPAKSIPYPWALDHIILRRFNGLVIVLGSSITCPGIARMSEKAMNENNAIVDNQLVKSFATEMLLIDHVLLEVGLAPVTRLVKLCEPNAVHLGRHRDNTKPST